ncbi:MAG: methyl-accepting chemotaxis protein [Actinomycetota bacterium]
MIRNLGSVQVKIGMVLLIAVLVPSAFLTWRGTNATSDALVTGAEDGLAGDASALAIAVEQGLVGTVSDLHEIQNLPPISRYFATVDAPGGVDPRDDVTTVADWQQRITGVMATYLDVHSTYRRLMFVDPSGDLLAYVTRTEQGVVEIPPVNLGSVAGEPFVDEMLALEPDEIYLSPVTNRLDGSALEYGVPAVDFSTGEVRGAIVATVSTEALFNDMSVISDGGVQTIVMDRDGRLLAHPNPDLRWTDRGADRTRQFLGPANAEAILAGGAGVVRAGGFVVAHTPAELVPGSGDDYLIVLQVADEPLVTAGATAFRNSSLLLMLALLAAAFLLGVYFTRRIVVTPLLNSSQRLAGAASDLEQRSQELETNAARTSHEATTASASGERVTHNVDEVSHAVEQMNTSIGAIAEQALEAERITTRAVEIAGQSTEAIHALEQSSDEIGNVIEMITSIAKQTNLLALNATIEAARAGESGKGFAVVANEVKELANQTARATDNVSVRIQSMQDQTTNAIAANAQIGDTISDINDISAAIAAAVKEQSDTTAQIGGNVEQAAAGSREMAAVIADVASVAEHTRESSAASKTSASQMTGMAEALERLVR